jgi:hypothetical protein
VQWSVWGWRRRRRRNVLTRLLSLPDVPSLTGVLPEEAQAPVLPIHFRRGETSLRLFTHAVKWNDPTPVPGKPGSYLGCCPLPITPRE